MAMQMATWVYVHTAKYSLWYSSESHAWKDVWRSSWASGIEKYQKFYPVPFGALIPHFAADPVH